MTEYARKNGALVVKLYQKRGWPDRLFLYRGFPLFVEFKRHGARPRPEQLRVHAQLRAQFFSVAVIDSVSGGVPLIRRWMGLEKLIHTKGGP